MNNLLVEQIRTLVGLGMLRGNEMVVNVLQRVSDRLCAEMETECKRVHQVAIELAKMKVNPAQPGNVPNSKPACETCSRYCDEYHGKARVEVKPKRFEWFEQCPWCKSTAMSGVVEAPKGHYFCVCQTCHQRCSKPEDETTEPPQKCSKCGATGECYHGKPPTEPVLELEPWWSACPQCGWKPEDAAVVGRHANGNPLHCKCRECGCTWGRNWKSETTTEPPPWWKVCPHCAWNVASDYMVVMGIVTQRKCAKCGQVWDAGDAAKGT